MLPRAACSPAGVHTAASRLGPQGDTAVPRPSTKDSHCSCSRSWTVEKGAAGRRLVMLEQGCVCQ